MEGNATSTPDKPEEPDEPSGPGPEDKETDEPTPAPQDGSSAYSVKAACAAGIIALGAYLL
jgi:hypothetical protein